MVKVSVAESLPANVVLLETNRPRNRVIVLRFAAVVVMFVAVVLIELNGPALAAASRNPSDPGSVRFALKSALSATLIVAVVERKSVNAG